MNPKPYLLINSETADLGFEKFMHIKSRTSDLKPQGAVIVGTIRAIKSHGGVKFSALKEQNSEAIELGIVDPGSKDKILYAAHEVAYKTDLKQQINLKIKF